MSESLASDGPLLVVGYRFPMLAKTGLLAVALPLFAAYCGYIAYGADDPTVAVVGLVGATMCALAALLIVPLYLRAILRALRGAPMLTLDREGVTLHSARVTLPWANVAEVRIDRMTGRGPGADTIVFVPVDENAAVAALRGLPRRFARDGIRRLGGPIALRAAQLTCPVDDFVAVLRSASVPVRLRHLPGRNPAVSR